MPEHGQLAKRLDVTKPRLLAMPLAFASRTSPAAPARPHSYRPCRADGHWGQCKRSILAATAAVAVTADGREQVVLLLVRSCQYSFTAVHAARAASSRPATVVSRANAWFAAVATDTPRRGHRHVEAANILMDDGAAAVNPACSGKPVAYSPPAAITVCHRRR